MVDLDMLLTYVRILFSFHLLGRHRLSLSKSGRGGCRSRELWKCVHTLEEKLRRRVVYLNPWLPSLLCSKVSLSLFDYTTFTMCSYYTCLVLLYRWRLIACSYFNHINNITISLSGVATSWYRCKWEWNLTCFQLLNWLSAWCYFKLLQFL